MAKVACGQAAPAKIGKSTGTPEGERLNRPLRVISINLWNYAEPYEQRMKLLREEIKSLDPDLIGFQEAGWTPDKEHQVQQLLRGLKFHIEHERKGAPPPRRELLDVAVASRWPFQRKAFWRLPGSGKALVMEIDGPAPMKKFLFVSTFGTNRWQFDREHARERDAVALDQHLRALADSSGFPPVITGDFDATPDSACMRYLTGRQSLDGRSTHYYDAWTAAGNDDPGATWSTRNEYARRTTLQVWHLANHHRRIDYILLGSPHHYCGFARVISSCVVFDSPANGVWPSDHFGVMAEIAVTK